MSCIEIQLGLLTSYKNPDAEKRRPRRRPKPVCLENYNFLEDASCLSYVYVTLRTSNAIHLLAVYTFSTLILAVFS